MGFAARDDRLEKIVPFDTLYGDVVERAPYSTRVVMGYRIPISRVGTSTTRSRVPSPSTSGRPRRST
jgi:hypothetical protein